MLKPSSPQPATTRHDPQARPVRLSLAVFALMLTIIWAVTYTEHQLAQELLQNSSTYRVDEQALIIYKLSYRNWLTFSGGGFLAGGISILVWLRLRNRSRELSDAKRIMDALTESEERMRLFVENAPSAVAMFDRNMRYLAVSQRWRDEFGLGPHANLTGLCHFDLASEIPEKMREIHRRCLDENVDLNEIGPVRLPNGKFRWVHWEVRPWQAADGSVGGLLMCTRDITESVSQQALLRDQASRLDLAIQSANLATWDFDVANEHVHFGGRGLTILGFDPSVKFLSTRRWYEKIHPEDRSQVDSAFQALLTGQIEELRIEYRVVRINGTWAWLSTVGRVTSRDVNGLASRAMGVSMDISDSKEAEFALKIATTDARRLANAIDSHSDAVILTDAVGNIVRVNHAYEVMTGYSKSDAIGRPLGSLEHSREHTATYRKMWETIRRGQPWSGRLCHCRKKVPSLAKFADCSGDTKPSAELYWADISVSLLRLPDGNVEGFVAVQRDVTDEVQREEQLAIAARTDELTGLGNRQFLQSRLERAVERQKKRAEHQFAVLFMDIDRFKLINDSLGHHFGDVVLQEVAARLRQILRCTDQVMINVQRQHAIRWGGDEFVVVLEQFDRPEDVVLIAERILKSLSEPYEFSGHFVQTSASIGIVIGDECYRTAAEIIRDADTALFEAKGRGKNCWVMFDGSMQKAVERRLQLESELRIQQNFSQFFLVYQPIVSAYDGCLRGVEALIRWNHPQLGLISPHEFIPVAEESRVIVDLGQWVIETACRQWLAWQETSSSAPEYVTINLSRIQLTDPAFVEKTTQVLSRTGIDPTRVVFEITESTVMKDPQAMKETLLQLKATGARLAIDDFGTGYSSLACLHEFPFDILKIDRSFISNFHTSGKLVAMTEAIITLGKHLGMLCVAEGAEDENQVAVLKSIGCNYVQGYFFGRPTPAAELFQQTWPARPTPKRMAGLSGGLPVLSDSSLELANSASASLDPAQ